VKGQEKILLLGLQGAKDAFDAAPIRGNRQAFQAADGLPRQESSSLLGPVGGEALQNFNSYPALNRGTGGEHQQEGAGESPEEARRGPVPRFQGTSSAKR
jgi:hypothetical protein